MVYTVTLDGGLLRERTLLPAVRTLKEWDAQGKIQLFESDRAKEPHIATGWPGGPPPQRGRRINRSSKKMESGGVSFLGLATVLFPNRDSHRLSMTEINDVAHLLRHHSLGHSIFVTTNEKSFLEHGKQERLRAAFKLVVLTPDEAVRVLREAEAEGPTPIAK